MNIEPTPTKRKKLHPVEAFLPIASIQRLAELKRVIVDGTDATEMLVKSAKEKSREALLEAILTGNALLEVNKILRGAKFQRWCSENLKDQTATRYIRLSQDVHHGGQQSITNAGLKKAYIRLGIIDEPTKPGIKAETGSINAAEPTN